MADFLTYANIIAELERALKHFQGAKEDLIKSTINQVYLNEIMVADILYPLYWLVDFDDSQLSVAPSELSAITKANPGVFTTDAAHGLSVGHLISLHNIVGMTELNNQLRRVVTVPTTTTFTIGVNTTDYTTYSSGGDVIHKGVTLNTSGKNVQRILSASWNYEASMREADYKEIEKNITLHHHDQTSRPQIWYHGKGYSSAGAETNQLQWFPGTDDAYRLRYWFEQRVSPLSSDADVPILPPQFHHMIIAGVITRLAENNVQVENAVIWPGIYKRQLNAFIQFNRRYWKRKEEAPKSVPYLI